MRTLQDQLIEIGLSRSRTDEIDRKSTSRTSARQTERMTDRDWVELMGVNRPTYGRKKGGAFRQS